MSEFMISLIIMDQSAYGLSGSGEILHYLKMPALAAGFLFFPLSRCATATDLRSRRMIMLFSNIVYIAGMTALMGLFSPVSVPGYLLSSMISLLSLGFLGGAVYYYFAMGLVNHPYLGRLSGIGGAAAFLIQISVQYLIPAKTAMLVLLCIGFAFTAYVTLFSKDRFDWMFDEPLEYAREGDPELPDIRVITTGVTAMVLLYMICALTDPIFISMNFAGEMTIYEWPRLLGAAGYLISGFLSDLGHRKWLPLSALCTAILCIPLPFMLKEGYTIPATCLYYVIVVSQINFLNIFFWDLAPKTKRPQLMAGMSRVISCACVTMLPLFSNIPVIAIIMIEVVLYATVILLMVFGGFLPQIHDKNAFASANRAVHDVKAIDKPPGKAPSISDELPENNAEASAGQPIKDKFNPDERPVNNADFQDDSVFLDEFAKLHGLTPREKDFLVLLLKSDDGVQVIALNMNLSTRTVYRHIKNIYEKTGTETRYSLVRYYYELKGS